jgi:L-fuconolactonase
MATRTIDIHPHVISRDDVAYPRAPLFGVQSDWSRERPVTIEDMIAAMDEAGVEKSAIVQASTCYGHDNSYLADGIAKHKSRLTGVCSVDIRAPDAVEKLKFWRERGMTGLRLFTGGGSRAADILDLCDAARRHRPCARTGRGELNGPQEDIITDGSLRDLVRRLA